MQITNLSEPRDRSTILQQVQYHIPICGSRFQLLNHALAHPLPHNFPHSTPNPLPRSLYVLPHTTFFPVLTTSPSPLAHDFQHICTFGSLNLPYLAPTSFCKCTCFSNSTIIPLNAPRPTPPYQQQQFPSRLLLDTRDQYDSNGVERGGGGGREEKAKKGAEDRKEFRAGNCGDCNRQYCIDAHLPICKDATVGDVVATCFRASPSFFFPSLSSDHLPFPPSFCGVTSLGSVTSRPS